MAEDTAHEVLAILTCRRDAHQWARVGRRQANGSISLGPISAPGAADDPTICPLCGGHEIGLNVLGGGDGGGGGGAGETSRRSRGRGRGRTTSRDRTSASTSQRPPAQRSATLWETTPPQP